MAVNGEVEGGVGGVEGVGVFCQDGWVWASFRGLGWLVWVGGMGMENGGPVSGSQWEMT